MIDKAIKALKNGEIVLLYDFDDRERETDLIVAAEFVTHRHIYQLRRDAGGLICLAADPAICKNLGIPYIADVLRCTGSPKNELRAVKSLCEKAGDIPYDFKSSFSLWINHRKTYTGITDKDRALTITRFAEIARLSMNDDQLDLGIEFRSPGHVPLLRAAPDLLKNRRGQTELSIVLARAAGVTPTVIMCEMLDGETGMALSKADAENYAAERGLAFTEGKEVEMLYKKMIE